MVVVQTRLLKIVLATYAPLQNDGDAENDIVAAIYMDGGDVEGSIWTPDG